MAIRHIDLASLSTHSHLALRWLPFYLKLYLHLASGGDVDVLPSAMPAPDRTSVRLMKGVRLAENADEPRVAIGGHLAYGNVIIDPSHLAMVAVKAKRIPTPSNPSPGYTTWYGELVFCFTAQYLGRTLQLCLVRWLDDAAAVSSRVVAATPEVRRGAVQAAERTRMLELLNAPFRAYRWEVALGSTAARHPAAGTPHYGVVGASQIVYRTPMVRAALSSCHDDDPTFFLNTDMWDL